MADNISKTALLVIDIQRVVTNKENKLKFGYNRCTDLINNVNRLIAYGQKEGWEIVYVAHSTPWYHLLPAAVSLFRFMKGSPEVKFDERLQVVSKNYFEKLLGNAFFLTGLKKFLKAKGIERVFISGLAADACVSSTAKAAHEKGYKVTVVTDSCLAKTDERARTAFAKLRQEFEEMELETTSNIVLR